MLLEFSVKNYMSIKNEMTFSMLAGNDTEKSENLIYNKNNKEKFLKTTAIYGANASGKSNFLNAITVAILNIRLSNIRNLNDELIEMVPFKFDKNTIKKPCEFRFVFIKNKIKYIYGFSADSTKVYTEYLYQYLTAKPSLVFERKNINEYKFPQSEQKVLTELARKNTANKLFLATATAWNYKKAADAYRWLSEDINVSTDYIDVKDYAFTKYENDKDGSLKRFTINLLNLIDIPIKDYNLDVQEAQNISSINSMVPRKVKKVKLSIVHEVGNGKGGTNDFELDFNDESLGTQNLFLFSPILKEAFETGKTVVIDEIDKSLHPLLVEFMIKLFQNPLVNKKNAQLIFNTHDTNLLTLDIFRRDQIWFTEKNPKTGATDIYPLDDFSVRKTENIQKGYLNGRYGAIPFLGTGNSLWDD